MGTRKTCLLVFFFYFFFIVLSCLIKFIKIQNLINYEVIKSISFNFIFMKIYTAFHKNIYFLEFYKFHKKIYFWQTSDKNINVYIIFILSLYIALPLAKVFGFATYYHVRFLCFMCWCLCFFLINIGVQTSLYVPWLILRTWN